MLKINPPALFAVIGMLPIAERKLVKKATPDQVGKAFLAFREKLTG